MATTTSSEDLLLVVQSANFMHIPINTSDLRRHKPKVPFDVDRNSKKNTKKRFRIIYKYLASKSQSCIHTTATCLRYILKLSRASQN